MEKIGLWTSGWDQTAIDLAVEVYRNFGSKVAYVFLSREEGETRYGDLMIQKVRELKLPLITFSSLRYRPWLRKLGKWVEKSLGGSFLTDFWRNLHDREVMKRLPPTNLIVLLGYMWWFSPEMCRQKTAINLHPALPTGPKGTYREVIWQLIQERATETGAIMHLVTPELDRGPAIAFCRFPIKSGGLIPLWQEMERRLEREPLEGIAEKEGENNPLFAAIRRNGVAREFPMVIETIRALAEGRIKIEGGKVVDSQGRVLKGGYDLTEQINQAMQERKRKERKGGKRK